ncbi:MAG: PQQ-binding-like beta-propeller repeat protein [Candidatus Caldarchaeum sp.]
MRTLGLTFLVLLIPLIVNAASSQQASGEWVSAGGTPLNTKYVMVPGISSSNVESLFQDWFLPIPPSRQGDIQGVTHPLLIKYGVGYAVTNGYLVYAFDMRGGKLFWTVELVPPQSFNPSVLPQRQGYVYQVLLAKHGNEELLVAGTSWQRVYMLDSFTGKLVNAFDLLAPNESVDGNAGRYGGLPVNMVYDGRRGILVVGSTSPDTENAGRGFVDGYQVSHQGVRRVWRVFLMPPQTTADPSWSVNFVKNTRHAWVMDGEKVVDLKSLDEAQLRSLLLNDWMAHGGSPPKAGVMAGWMNGWAVDEEAGVAYLGVSNPMPSLSAEGRGGPNIPSSSVLAVRVETGEVLWMFQAIPHDVWGYGCNGGVSVVGRVVLALCGNGRLYALDKDTGRLVWMFKPPSLKEDELSRPLSIFDKNQMSIPRMGYGLLPDGANANVSPPPHVLLSYAVNPNSGKVFYAFPAYSETIKLETPLNPKTPFSMSKQSDLFLYSVDISTGRVVWEKMMEGVGSGFVSATSDIILLQTTTSSLYVFYEKDGALLYSKQAVGSSMVHPSVGVDVEGAPRLVVPISTVNEPGYVASFRLIPPVQDQNVAVVTEHTTITRTITTLPGIGEFGGGLLFIVLILVIVVSVVFSLVLRFRRSREPPSG